MKVTKEWLKDNHISFDTAIPISFTDRVDDVFDNVSGHIVWAYPHNSIWGMPIAITDEGQDILEKYDIRCGTSHSKYDPTKGPGQVKS